MACQSVLDRYFRRHSGEIRKIIQSPAAVILFLEICRGSVADSNVLHGPCSTHREVGALRLPSERVSSMSKNVRRDDPQDLVTPRQIELLRLLGCGLTLGEAAERMGITKKTANVHKCRLMHRLELGTREDLVAYVGKAFPKADD